MLDLWRLRSFVAVARHQSVSRAARELHISQSPLSRQIAALEEDLGLALFTRHKQRLRLTPAGEALLRDAEGLIASAEAVERRARSLAAGAAGHVTIGYVAGAVHSGAVPAAVAALRRAAPAATVELRAMRSAEQLAALDRGVIDVGFAHAAPTDAALSSALILEEPFVLAAPASEDGDLALLVDRLPLVTVPASVAPASADEIRRAYVAVGGRSTAAIEAFDPAVVLRLIAAGLGVGLVQQSLAAGAPGVRSVPLPPGLGLVLRVYRINQHSPPPLVAALCAQMEYSHTEIRPKDLQ